MRPNVARPYTSKVWQDLGVFSPFWSFDHLFQWFLAVYFNYLEAFESNNIWKIKGSGKRLLTSPILEPLAGIHSFDIPIEIPSKWKLSRARALEGFFLGSIHSIGGDGVQSWVLLMLTRTSSSISWKLRTIAKSAWIGGEQTHLSIGIWRNCRLALVVMLLLMQASKKPNDAKSCLLWKLTGMFLAITVSKDTAMTNRSWRRFNLLFSPSTGYSLVNRRFAKPLFKG